MHYTYVLFSEHDKRLYTGTTGDLPARLKLHAAGRVQSTAHRRPHRHTLAAHGLPPVPDSEWMRGVGTPLRVQLGPWARSPEDLQAMVATYRDFNLANHDRMIAAFPDVVDHRAAVLVWSASRR